MQWTKYKQSKRKQGEKCVCILRCEIFAHLGNPCIRLSFFLFGLCLFHGGVLHAGQRLNCFTKVSLLKPGGDVTTRGEKRRQKLTKLLFFLL